MCQHGAEGEHELCQEHVPSRVRYRFNLQSHDSVSKLFQAYFEFAKKLS